MSLSIPSFIPRDELETLAPVDLPNLRSDRYDGGSQSARWGQFSPADQGRLRAIYDSINGLYPTLTTLAHAERVAPAAVQALKERPEMSRIQTAARGLGSDAVLSPALRTIVHDIRGGSLLALLVSLELLELAAATPDDLLRIFFYARDHLKMMRNGIPEIDPVQSALDQGEKPHGAGLLRQKWTGARFAFGGRLHPVVFECGFEGNVATRCMEFSALDRVIYNLMNNAARFAVQPELAMTIFVPAGTSAQAVRFVVQNAITPAQADRVAQLTNHRPSQLFLGGLTTGGHGLGLSICTEFVRHAFGISSMAAAVDRGYVGAQLAGGNFVAWFHWPRA